MHIKFNPVVISETFWRKTRHARRQSTAVLIIGFADYEALLRGGIGSSGAIAWMALAVLCSVALAAYFIWLASRVCRLLGRHPKIWVFSALAVGGFAGWRAYSTAFDSTPASTAWSCLSAAMLLAVAMYGIYQLIGCGLMPAGDSQH